MIIVGWIIWGVLVCFALTWAWSARVYIKRGQGEPVQFTTATQTMFLWFTVILFPIFNWNKLHILWVAPISIFLAQILTIGDIPILSSIFKNLTKLFLKIILVDSGLPYFIIALFGLTGLIIGGIFGGEILGLTVGLIGGYIIVLLTGIFLCKLDGGILPKKVRKQTASKFAEQYDPLIITIFPNATKDEKILHIENLLEIIFKKSSITASNTHSGVSYQDVENILDTIIEQEHDLKKKELIIKLWDFLKQEWYPDKRA